MLEFEAYPFQFHHKLKKKIDWTRCGEKMHAWGENIKKRRARQIRSIQHRQATSYPFQKEWEIMEDVSLWKQSKTGSKRTNKWIRKITMQTILSFMLFIVTYLLFQHDSASKALITEAMNRPFNFQGVTAWFDQKFGTPTILPAFQPATVERSSWRLPVEGKMVLPFNRERNGVIVRTQKNAKVVAPVDSWVVFAGEKGGMGQTVILRHVDGTHIWLSLLAACSVKEKQWIKKGEPIGVAGNRAGQSLVYIAIEKNGKYINPTAVIPFD